MLDIVQILNHWLDRPVDAWILIVFPLVFTVPIGIMFWISHKVGAWRLKKESHALTVPQALCVGAAYSGFFGVFVWLIDKPIRLLVLLSLFVVPVVGAIAMWIVYRLGVKFFRWLAI